MCVRNCLGQKEKLSGDDCEPSYRGEKRIHLLLEGFLETPYLYSAIRQTVETTCCFSSICIMNNSATREK